METINIAILVTGGVVIGLVAWMIARRMRKRSKAENMVASTSPDYMKYGVQYQFTNVADQINRTPDDGLKWIGAESDSVGSFYVVNDVSKSAVFEFYDKDGKLPPSPEIQCLDLVTLKVNGKWLCETYAPLPIKDSRLFVLLTSECDSKAPKMLFNLAGGSCGPNGQMFRETFYLETAQSVVATWIPVNINKKSAVSFCVQNFTGVPTPVGIKECILKATEKV